jgi:lactate permease
MLIAFAFGAFIEGAAGFGTPVAVAAAMLTGLGFSPFFAAGICLLANTAPVAFGSIGIPVVTLAGTTGIDKFELSAWVGRLCAPISLLIPAYLILVMGGFRGLKGVLPAAIVCGICFASVQFLVSNFVGPELVDIMASLSAILGLVVLFKVWQPKDRFVMAGEHDTTVTLKSHGVSRTLLAWSPYLFLVVFVLLWGYPGTARILAKASIAVLWPGLHNEILRVAPVVAAPAPYAASYNFNWLAAAGTACAFATIAAAFTLRVSVGMYLGLLAKVAKQLAFSILTIACVLGLAYLMNYSGMTVTLGLAFAATGALFPFFSSLLGWLGVFLTGSDTSSNALFGNLQVVTANSLHLNPATMAASNSAGGVMGKMISLTSLAVAVAATGMDRSEEGKLFRFTVKHSVFLASLLGILATIYAYA